MVQGLEFEMHVHSESILMKQTMPILEMSAGFDRNNGMSDARKEKVVSLVSELKQALDKMSRCPNARPMMNSVASDRNCAVSSLRCLNVFYGSDTQTFALAVSFLDRFLAKIKVQNKYLSCVAAACYFLAAKINEEPENQPNASELSFLHRQTWKSSDLMRMEFVILEKLNWDLSSVTCPVILRILCDVLELCVPEMTTPLLERVFSKFEICINYNTTVLYQPSTLALCIIQKTIQDLNLQTSATSQCLLWLHQLCDVTDSEIFECYNTVSNLLDNYENKPKSHPVCLPIPKPQPRMSLISRPSYYGDSDLPTIEEDTLSEDINLQINEDSELLESFKYGKRDRSWSYCILPDRCLLPVDTCFTYK